jgi:GAF domain-containing protein
VSDSIGVTTVRSAAGGGPAVTRTEATTDSAGHELPTWASLPAVADPQFDELARRVAAELQVPRALVVLVSKAGQVYPGAFGLPEPWASQRSMPLSQSLSRQVVATGTPLVLRDARVVPELSGRAAIRELAVVGYAAMPMADAQGRPIGVLCVSDDRPRDWTATELSTLRRLAGETAVQLQFRALELAEGEARAAAERADVAARQAVDAASTAVLTAEADVDRTRVVARLSSELLPATTVPDVLEAVDRFVRSPLGAVVALLGLATAGSPDIRIWSATAGARPSAQPVAGLRLGDEHPLAAAVRERRLVLVPAGTPPLVLPAGAVESSIAVPLVLGQHASTGALLIGWGLRRDLDPQVQAVVRDLSRHVGVALDRVLLREQRLRLAAASSP